MQRCQRALSAAAKRHATWDTKRSLHGPRRGCELGGGECGRHQVQQWRRPCQAAAAPQRGQRMHTCPVRHPLTPGALWGRCSKCRRALAAAGCAAEAGVPARSCVYTAEQAGRRWRQSGSATARCQRSARALQPLCGWGTRLRSAKPLERAWRGCRAPSRPHCQPSSAHEAVGRPPPQPSSIAQSSSPPQLRSGISSHAASALARSGPLAGPHQVGPACLQSPGGGAHSMREQRRGAEQQRGRPGLGRRVQGLWPAAAAAHGSGCPAKHLGRLVAG